MYGALMGLHAVEQSVLRKAGAQNVSTVFLFNDTQLKKEQFLEDINNILNRGEESCFLLNLFYSVAM